MLLAVLAIFVVVGAIVWASGSGSGSATPSGPAPAQTSVIRPEGLSVHLAFPGIPYEIEVYDPSPTTARRLAASGDIRPVG